MSETKEIFRKIDFSEVKKGDYIIATTVIVKDSIRYPLKYAGVAHYVYDRLLSISVIGIHERVHLSKHENWAIKIRDQKAVNKEKI